MATISVTIGTVTGTATFPDEGDAARVLAAGKVYLRTTDDQATVDHYAQELMTKLVGIATAIESRPRRFARPTTEEPNAPA